jgi:predicted nuclease of predicted toxin-antitoxin system
MKLLFDQNLSFKLCQSIADIFPESSHVAHSGLSEAGDRDVWDYAKTNGFAIVSAGRKPIDRRHFNPATAPCRAYPGIRG